MKTTSGRGFSLKLNNCLFVHCGLGWVLGLGFGFGIGNLIGGTAGAVDTHFYDVIRMMPCARKTPVLLLLVFPGFFFACARCASNFKYATVFTTRCDEYAVLAIGQYYLSICHTHVLYRNGLSYRETYSSSW